MLSCCCGEQRLGGGMARGGSCCGGAGVGELSWRCMVKELKCAVVSQRRRAMADARSVISARVRNGFIVTL